MSTHSLHRVALAGLLLLAACEKHRESDDVLFSPPAIFGPGQWTIARAAVLDSKVPGPPPYDVGDTVSFELDRLISARRGTTEESFSRAAIEARLGFELDEYVNHGYPAGVSLHYVADRRNRPEGYRLVYYLAVHISDWDLPPLGHEEWMLERPDEPPIAWQAQYSFAKNPRPLDD